MQRLCSISLRNNKEHALVGRVKLSITHRLSGADVVARRRRVTMVSRFVALIQPIGQLKSRLLSRVKL